MTASSAVTVAVIVLGGPSHLKRCLGSLVPQLDGLPIDVVVPFDHTVPDLGEARAAFPFVTFLDLGVLATVAQPGSAAARHELFDYRIAAVLAQARGTHVALLQDWGAPAPNWCQALLETARLPHAAVGGAVDHTGRGVLSWAVYFLDFGRHQSPVREGPSRVLSDANVMYRCDALAEIRHVWSRRYNEALVNWALLERGKVLWRTPALTVHCDRGPISWGPLLAERLSWGRLFGAARARALSSARVLPYVVFSPLIPFVVVGRSAATVLVRRRHWGCFLQAFPAFVLLTVVWTAGELMGYITRQPSPDPAPGGASEVP